MAKKTGKPKLGDVESILEWAEEAISLKRDARVAADEAVAYAEQALGFRPRERNAILLTKEARLALIECESHASRAKDRRWAVESLAPPHRGRARRRWSNPWDGRPARPGSTPGGPGRPSPERAAAASRPEDPC